MSCPQTENQTLLWLYGELDPALEAEQLRHIGACTHCAEVVETHEQVAVALAPIAPVLKQVGPVVEGLAPANNRPWIAGAALVAAAAAVVLLWGAPRFETVQPSDTDLAVLVDDRDLNLLHQPLFGEVDGDLEALDLELADLSYDLSTL